MSRESIKAAAQLGTLGLDPMRFLETRDSFERSLMIELGNEMVEFKKTMDMNLATMIANQVGKLFKG